MACWFHLAGCWPTAEEWAALGTWVTGASAAMIAWLAWRSARAKDSSRALVESRRVIAFERACRLEMETLRGMVHAALAQAGAAIKMQDLAFARGSLFVYARMFDFRPPRAWLSSPLVGHLEPATAKALIELYVAASDAERMRRACSAVLRDTAENVEPRSEDLQFLESVRSTLVRVNTACDALDPLLST